MSLSPVPSQAGKLLEELAHFGLFKNWNKS
jgi:hypothetical protein